MKTGVFIGRFQPFHDGHKACINRILETCGRVLILVRDGVPNEKNPYSFEQRVRLIGEAFPNDNRIQVIRVPDDDHDLTVYRGREVGWQLEDIKLDPDTEAISATKIRAQNGQ